MLKFMLSQNPLTFPLYPNTISYIPAVNQSAVELSQEIISGGSFPADYDVEVIPVV
jgi:hypothetical protein